MTFVNVWPTVLMCAISLARTGMGIYTSMNGPTLLYLAKNVNVSVSKISIMLAGRSLGNLLGAVLGGVLKRSVWPNFRHLLTLGAAIGICGLTSLAIPWIKEFWLLILDNTVGGIMFGYLDAGLQALILQLYGEQSSRTKIQIFHLTCTVGSVVAPLIATPFLAESERVGSTKFSCPNFDSFISTAPVLHNRNDPSPIQFNPTGWAYIISSFWMMFVSILLLLLSAFNVEAKVNAAVTDKGYSSEERREEPIKNLICFFILVTCYFFCCVATENTYYNFIYSVSICSDIHFTVTQASHLTSVFWIGFILGRLTGVILANFLQPKTLIILSLFGCTVGMGFVSIFGKHSVWLMWVVTATHGYSAAMLYPSGVSWVSQITNVSETYMFIFNIGHTAGIFCPLLIAGYLFDNVGPFSVMYLIWAASVGSAVAFLMLHYVGNKHVVHKSNSDSDNE